MKIILYFKINRAGLYPALFYILNYLFLNNVIHNLIKPIIIIIINKSKNNLIKILLILIKSITNNKHKAI